VEHQLKKLFLIIKDYSERVKSKNFREIEGLSLHEYFIRQRKDWDIFIDTDSPRIVEFYSDNSEWPNVTTYNRLPEHVAMEASGNISPAPLMIERFLREYAADGEIIVTSHVTSPFISDETIRSAIDEMGRYDSVSSVLALKEFTVLGVGANCPAVNFDPSQIVKTQSLTPVGVLNGAFFIIRKEIFLKNGLRRISDNHFYYEINQIEALDIDTEHDLLVAQSIAKVLK